MRIAVVILEDLAEGLRVSAGLSILDDRIDVYLLDRDNGDLPAGDAQVRQGLEMAQGLGLGMHANRPGIDGFGFLTNAEVARRLLEYERIVTF